MSEFRFEDGKAVVDESGMTLRQRRVAEFALSIAAPSPTPEGFEPRLQKRRDVVRTEIAPDVSPAYLQVISGLVETAGI